jgi:hypothetical protein
MSARHAGLVLGLFVALVTATGLASDASADFYPAQSEDELRSRSKTLNGNTYYDTAYAGPPVVVRGSTTNTDSYQCNYGAISNWAAVAGDLPSAYRSFTSVSNAYAKWQFGSIPTRFSVTTTDWSTDDINIRVVYSCTGNSDLFPYATGNFLWDFGNWVAGLFGRHKNWHDLINGLFGWGSDPARASFAVGMAGDAEGQRARDEGNRFELENGRNELVLNFEHPLRSRRPPAFFLSTDPADADCEARRMHVPVIEGNGTATLTLRCRGLEAGATARLTIRESIRRSFRLGQGDGTVRVHLDKPPGKVEPLVHIATRPAHQPCRVLDHKLDVDRTEMDLTVDAHCKRVERGAKGVLYVGGLLAPTPESDGRRP